MFVVTVLVFLGAGLAANSEIHSLTYICTALSKPDGTPGVHKFISMGLMDGREIEYYDSESKRKVPKQEWMRERLPADYWGKGTEEPWLESLMNLMRQNDSVVHVFQGMRGCEGKMQPDGTLKFHHGMHTYAYDGDNLLSFDYKNEFWIAPITEAQLTMRDWDSDQAMKEHIKRYLENECIDRLKMFLDYRKKQLENTPPPDVYVFAKNSRVDTNLILTCLATGFYTKDIIVRIRRNRHVLAKEDGVMSSGGLPNGDDTFQRRDHVEVLRSDLSVFICDVTHEATNTSVKKLWDRSQLSDAVRSRALSLPVLAVVLLLLYTVVIRGRRRGANNNQGSSDPAGTPLMTGNDSSNGSDPSNISTISQTGSGITAQNAEVEVYAQHSKDGKKLLLTCIARGQGVIDVEIKHKEEGREEEIVTEENGLMKSDAEINNDGTLEIRAHVEIKGDKSKYSCGVICEKQNIKCDFACALHWRGPPEVQWRWIEIPNLEDYPDPIRLLSR